MAAFVDLKQTECQIFLQQRWVYLESSENCDSGSVPTVSTCRFPQGKGRVLSKQGKGSWQDYVQQKACGFPWLSPYWSRRIFLLPIECMLSYSFVSDSL